MTHMKTLTTWAFMVLLALAASFLGTAAMAADEPAADEKPAAEASLYDRLGGLAPISVVVSDFLDVLVPDPVLNRNPAIDEARSRVPAAYLKYHVTAQVCQVTGGPCQYHGRGMQQSHSHLNITEAEWDRMAELFVGVLDKHGVPQAEQQELLAIVGTTKADIVKTASVAVGGHDVVAYFTAGRPVPGSAEHSHTWNDQTWHFASAEHLAMFREDPARYAPAYDGLCAWGVVNGKEFPASPEFWNIHDGRLFLNLDAEVQENWKKDLAGNVARADSNWPDNVD